VNKIISQKKKMEERAGKKTRGEEERI